MADFRSLVMLPLILIFAPPDPVQAVSDVILHAEVGSSVLLPCGVHLGNYVGTDETTKLKWTRDGQDFATDLSDEEPRCVVPEFTSRCGLFSDGSLQIQNLQETDSGDRYHCRRGKGDDDFPVFSNVGLNIHKKESPNCKPQGNVVEVNGQTFEQSDYEYNLQMELNFESSSNNGNSVGINYTVTSGNGLASSCIIQVTDVDDCSGSPCLNGATCVDRLLGFTCNCSPGWTGLLCDIYLDDCSSRPCLNGATCVNRLPGFTCDCTPGWTGHQCDVEARNCVGADVSAVLLVFFLLIAILAAPFVCYKRTCKPRNVPAIGGVSIVLSNAEEGQPLNSLGNNTQQGNDTPREKKEQLIEAVKAVKAKLEQKLRTREEEHDEVLKRVKERFELLRAHTQKEHDKEMSDWKTRRKKERDDLEAELEAEFDEKKKAFMKRIEELEDAPISLKGIQQKNNTVVSYPDEDSRRRVQGNPTGERYTAVSHPEDSSKDSLLLSNTWGLASVDTSLSEGVGKNLLDKGLQESQKESNYGDHVLSHEYGSGSKGIDFTFTLKGHGLRVNFYMDEDKTYKSYSLRIAEDHINLFLYDATDPIRSVPYLLEGNVELAFHGVENQLRLFRIEDRGSKCSIFTYEGFSRKHCFWMVICKSSTCQTEREDIVLQL